MKEAVMNSSLAKHSHVHQNKQDLIHYTRQKASYLFKYLILTQIIIYLEAGAIPCLLDELSVSLQMNATQQGALGGVVYLALSIASPFGAYCLHHYSPRHVLGMTLVCNNIAVLVLAFTPTIKAGGEGTYNPAYLMIAARALIGFTQAFPCIYTPLWVDEYAPREHVATWMSYLQGSVPIGVMLGYLLGSISNWVGASANGSGVFTFASLEIWRWPFLLQFMAMCPVMIAVFFVPLKYMVIRNDYDASATTSSSSSRENANDEHDGGTTTELAAQSSEGSVIPTEESSVDDCFEKVKSICKPKARSHRDKAGARRTKNRHTQSLELGGVMGFFEDSHLMPASRTSRTSSRHDEADALLASAGMYGSSSQRGMRQLVENQRQHFNLTEIDCPSPSHRHSLLAKKGRENPSWKIDNADRPWLNEQSPEVIETAAITPLTPDRTPRKAMYGTVEMRNLSSSKASEYSFLDDETEVGFAPISFRNGLVQLFHVPIFGLIVFGLTAVYFVVTGVQYWSTIFMIKSLHASKYLVNVLFVFVAGTGPIMGVFYGGWLIDRYGGYIGPENRARSLGICMILGVTAFVIAAITTFLNDLYVTAFCLWLLLFFGGSILPACTGIFISVVPPRYRALASSISVMIFNLFGYSLSPYLTGWIMQWVLAQRHVHGSYFETCDEACAYRIGFRFCLFWSIWSFVCIGSAWILAKRELPNHRHSTAISIA